MNSGTGDVYEYGISTCEFYPVANVGLHKHNATFTKGHKAAVIKPEAPKTDNKSACGGCEIQSFILKTYR